MTTTDKKYRQLMFYKHFFIFGNLLVFFISFLMFELFAIIPAAIFAYISMMVFLAKNTCPWCNQPFFIYTEKGAQMDGLSILFQKQCINCDNPHDDDATINNANVKQSS